MKKINLEGLNEQIYYHKTKEGLDVYVWQNKRVNSSFFSLAVKYGSIHTDFKIGNKKYHVPNGIAHFLEHIKFNIDKDTTAHDVFNNNGADANAFTTFLYTSYVLYTTNNINKNLNTLLDFVYNPYFTKTIINKEKPIIVEEANMGIDDPYNSAFFSSLKQIFSHSNYRNTITGTEDDINSITQKDIELVYNIFYHPENMFLIATGNVNPYEIAKICDENLGSKTFNEYQKPIIITPKEDKKIEDTYKEDENNVINTRVRYSIKIPLKYYSDFTKLELRLYLGIILQNNFGFTSDFNNEMTNEGLINSMYESVFFMDDYAIVIVNAETEYKDEVIEKLKNKFNNLELKKEDFLRKKKVNIASLILQFEHVEVINDSIADDLIEYDGIVSNIKPIYESLSYDNALSIMNSLNNHSSGVYVMKPNKKQN